MNIIILILFYFNMVQAVMPVSEPKKSQTPVVTQESSENAEDSETDIGTETTSEVLPAPTMQIKALPYVSIINKDTLKSYKWWLTTDKKVPSVYKNILKKIMTDLRKEAIVLKYEFIPTTNIEDLNKEEMKTLGIGYVLTGEVLYDKTEKNKFSISGLKIKSLADENDIFFQKYGKVDTVRALSSLTSDMAAHFRSRLEPLPPVTPIVLKEKLFLKFQIALEFNEIEKIKEQILSEIPAVESIQIYSLQGGETTLAIYPKDFSQAKNIFLRISDLHFLKGPYNKQVEPKTLILKPLITEGEDNGITDNKPKSDDPTGGSSAQP